MTEYRMVLARAAGDAGERIGAARPAHLALVEPMAAAGELVLGVPLLDASGAYAGSLMLVTPAAAERYLEAEPFRREGVWRDWSVHPFRLAPLDYRPLPRGPAPAVPSHTVVIAWDGRDAAAPDRRLAVREAHFGRARAAASAGIITLGGALLESPGGRMIGSLAITAHPDVAVARAWWAADPYVTGGVWQEIAWHATRFAPLPYRPLLGAAA